MTKRKNITITVRPGVLSSIELGIFPVEEAIPAYAYDCLPDVPEIIATHEVKLKTPRGIRLVCHVQNFGNETVQVFPRPLIGEE